jgi:hypothetical protein
MRALIAKMLSTDIIHVHYNVLCQYIRTCVSYIQQDLNYKIQTKLL